MGMEDFMKRLAETPAPEIDPEFFELERRYQRAFGHAVPREMLPPAISPEQIKQAVETCLATETDNFFEILGVTINADSLY